MKAYRGDHLSWLQIVQTEPTEATITEFYVDADLRGKGVGTRLMTQTCRDADREGVILFVEPLPMGAHDSENDIFYPPEMNYKQLCAYYRQFGFRYVALSKELMMRKPKRRD